MHEVGIAGKELGEAAYWLKLAVALELIVETTWLREADELVAILVASARTARSRG